ncbi:3',5'-cyclic-nucleotide phosphodiesterase [Desulfovibrio ferrophilus]|uniref:Metal-dependent hydrolase, beta-lactamase superfamily III n=1 Tax=Desulfovibrio ferrophilus TaxID=241368 RepID=A0A2Z6AYU5_9BACT|nr:3',5'-cyclic-nucleotide phosphodiesterase [Desulfovibrio ferrophilus]BBD08419.1 metal-dependent hydrolase, beta-lactamase superfamily III [Desulfovibrio ferrophilus]
MKFKVLGCSGSRQPGHNLTSYCINDTILLDAGAVCGYLDVEDQERITHILVSHANLDHTKDIAFLADNLASAVFAGRKGPVQVCSQISVLKSLKDHLFNDDIWPDFTAIPSKEQPTIVLEPIEFGVPLHLGGLNVIAFPVPHSSGSTGFALYGEDPAEHVVVTGDTGPNGGWTSFVNDLHFPVNNLVVECSFPNELEGLALASDHLTPRLLKQKVERLKIKPVLYVTHLKAIYTRQIQKELQHELAGYQYHLPRKGVVYDF